MTRSATRNLVTGLGLLILGLDLAQDVVYFHGFMSAGSWSGMVTGQFISALVRNLLLVVGLGLVLFRQQSGWTVLALLAVFTLIRRALWFVGAADIFDSLGSQGFQVAFSTADLLFRLFCLTVLVDLVRQSRASSKEKEE